MSSEHTTTRTHLEGEQEALLAATCLQQKTEYSRLELLSARANIQIEGMCVGIFALTLTPSIHKGAMGAMHSCRLIVMMCSWFLNKGWVASWNGAGGLIPKDFRARRLGKFSAQAPRDIRRPLRGARRPQRELAEVDTRRKVDVIGVIDFECTCEEGWGYLHEVIEFPLVLVDCKQGRVLGEFHSFVRPVENATLSDFCTQLTGIAQETVDSAPDLPAVLDLVDAFLRSRNLVGDDANVSFSLATDGWLVRYRNSLEKCLVYTQGPAPFS